MGGSGDGGGEKKREKYNYLDGVALAKDELQAVHFVGVKRVGVDDADVHDPFLEVLGFYEGYAGRELAVELERGSAGSEGAGMWYVRSAGYLGELLLLVSAVLTQCRGDEGAPFEVASRQTYCQPEYLAASHVDRRSSIVLEAFCLLAVRGWDRRLEGCSGVWLRRAGWRGSRCGVRCKRTAVLHGQWSARRGRLDRVFRMPSFQLALVTMELDWAVPCSGVVAGLQ